MTEQEQRIAIAEACGRKLFVIHKPVHDPFGYYRENACGYTGNIKEAWQVTAEVAAKYTTSEAYKNEPDRVVAEPAPPPDYPNDLNACASLIDEINRRGLVLEYIHNLARIVTPKENNDHYTEIGWWIAFELVRATAAQRAEAFLRTIGKWKE